MKFFILSSFDGRIFRLSIHSCYVKDLIKQLKAILDQTITLITQRKGTVKKGSINAIKITILKLNFNIHFDPNNVHCFFDMVLVDLN